MRHKRPFTFWRSANVGRLDGHLTSVLTVQENAGVGGDPGGIPRIGVIVVAYNAASTLAAVLDRLPEAFRSKVADVVVCDDASSDVTFLVGTEYQK
jgi:hypothetical protein